MLNGLVYILNLWLAYPLRFNGHIWCFLKISSNILNISYLLGLGCKPIEGGESGCYKLLTLIKWLSKLMHWKYKSNHRK